MRKGLIYKYTNKINGKIYIGQTIQTLVMRHKKHLNDGKNSKNKSYFDRALKKYGENNFILEVVENNIDADKIDEREIYWIKYFDSYYTSGKGYNMTKGGKWSTSAQKLHGFQEDEIKRLLIEDKLSYREICETVHATMDSVSGINLGKAYYDSKLTYPLRKSTVRRTILNEDMVKEIINDLKTHPEMSENDIAKKLNISPYTVLCINRGKSKTYSPKNINYPIRKFEKDSTYNSILTFDKVKKMCYEIIFTKYSLVEIGKHFGVKPNTVTDISRGIAWKEITNKFKLPIRTNVEENAKIWKSIYGIV